MSEEKQETEEVAAFSRPTKEEWRWYAWTRMKSTDPKRWFATCWAGDTKEIAEQKREMALMEDDIIILVKEVMTYSATP